MHEAADHETADGAAREVKRGPLFHVEVPHQPPLGEEVRRQLHGAPHTGTDHGGADTPVEPKDAIALADLLRAVEKMLIPVLRPDGRKGREALQACLDEEEGRAHGSADDARGGAAEHVDTHALNLGVAKDEVRDGPAHGLVEAEAAAVEEDLVDVGRAEAAVDAAEPLVADDDGDAVEGAPIVVRLVGLGLEFALELHSADGNERQCLRPISEYEASGGPVTES